MTPRFEDISGNRFGKLTVLSFHEKVGRRYFWLCKCDCGKTKVIMRDSLVAGTRSCGCERKVSHYKHGYAKKNCERRREYVAWTNAKCRCHDESHKQYKDYGARGITMCQTWRNDFSVFINDMGPCPKGMFLERVNNNKGYSPGNCIWASRETQANNTRSNVFITVNGIRKTRVQWARYLNRNYSTIGRWIKKGIVQERICKELATGEKEVA